MNMQTYEVSIFWVILDRVNDLLIILTPILVFIACLYWLVSSRNKVSTLALIGSVFSLVGKLYETLFPGLNTVYIPGGPSMIDDSSFNMFFYLHAESFGYFMVASCLVIYFRGKYRNV